MTDPFKTQSTLGQTPEHSGLDFDEAAVDSLSQVEGFYEGIRTKQSTFWIIGIFFASVSVLVIRLFGLQIIEGSTYRVMAEENRLRSGVILAPRGLLLDRFGKTLAENTASFNLVATPFDLPKEGVPELVTLLSGVFNFDEQEAKTLVARSGNSSLEPVVIKQDVAVQEAILFETRALEFPGFSIKSIPVRDYKNPEMFSHVLGYAGIVNENELKDLRDQGYQASDYIGKAGIELSYEKYLRGTNGQERVEVNALGRPVNVLGTLDPKPGNTISLTIDKELQEHIYQEFIKLSPRIRGAAIALDPRTGAVLALLSLPGFNNNLFAHGISQADYQSLITDKTLPLFDRAISGTYPPGSTVKPMVGLAALENNIVTENTTIVDRGVLVIPNQFNPAQSYNFYGWKRDGLGPMTVRSAIAQSSDIYFYTVSGGHPSSPVSGMGIVQLSDYYRKFELQKTTGLDLEGEKFGLVPDPQWKGEYYKNDPIAGKWYLGDTYHVGIGQGDMLVTPLRIATMTALFANNGVGMRPQLLFSVVDANEQVIKKFESAVGIEKFASDKNIKIIQEGMRQTILAGSGRRLNTLPISSAGKTGTSQFDGSDPSRTHAWFTAYAPFENPEIVMTVLVEAGGGGDVAAVPIVNSTLQWWAENRYNK